MNPFKIYIIVLFFIFSMISTALPSGTKTDTTSTTKKSVPSKKSTSPKKNKKKPKEPKFQDVIDGYDKIEGLFTIYRSKEEGKVYLAIKPAQLGPVYLCNITRQSGDAYLFDSGAMLGQFPFFIRRVGKQVQFVRKNVAFRASAESAIRKALEEDISNSIWGSAKVASQPDSQSGAILIDAAEIFLKDYNYVGYITGLVKMSYSFDRKNSFFSELKSFPENTEIEVTLHFKSSKPRPFFTLSDSRSMFHRYHYSLSTLPETGYKPRIADDRLGHFLTFFQDYTSLVKDTPYRHYINRWQLEKSEPRFKLSPPKKPIVFWLENTIPVEYRDAVREGVLLWNKAFERIGFKDAIIVKQMPDDADWDPADVRYNTIRWIVQPGMGYAVGPSRANPFTGQIYDADIRVSADFVRFYAREFSEFITPLSWMNIRPDRLWWDSNLPDDLPPELLPYQCTYSTGLMHQMAFGWSYLMARGLVNPDDLQKFVHDGIVELVVHEVGHTLGLRHNFKSSSTVPLEKLSDPEYTRKNGISASVMDYNPINLWERKGKRGAYFQTTLGAYDYWAIEYAYKPLDPDSPISEKEMLEEIASRVADPHLQYGTDEDAFGYSTRGIDPLCNLFDLGDNPIGYFEHRAQLAHELWKEIPEKFEKKGERYQKFRKVFLQGLGEISLGAITIPRFVGGIYQHRDHVGDPHGRPPFEVVPAKEQRRALQYLVQNLFAPDAFRFSPELLNKLAPERLPDFEGTLWRTLRIDFPIHGVVQVIQANALFRLYDPLVLQRLQDNEVRFPSGADKFTMAEMFTTLRNAIWSELDSGENINSYRRELQRMHLYLLNRILLKTPAMVPHDAVTLARLDMKILRDKIDAYFQKHQPDVYTTAHLEEVRARIEAALKAQVQRSL